MEYRYSLAKKRNLEDEYKRVRERERERAPKFRVLGKVFVRDFKKVSILCTFPRLLHLVISAEMMFVEPVKGLTGRCIRNIRFQK